MNTEIFVLTANKNSKDTEKLCRKIIGEYPELQEFYDSLFIFLIDSNSLYAEKISALFSISDPENFLPSIGGVAKSVAIKRKGAITVKVDNFDPKAEWVLQEECCHLADFKGDGQVMFSYFDGFMQKYVASNKVKLGTYLTNRLLSHFSHFNVNQMMIRHNIITWLEGKGHLYDSSKERIDAFFISKEQELVDDRDTLAFLIQEAVAPISFKNAINTIVQSNVTSEIKRQLDDLSFKTNEYILAFQDNLQSINRNVPNLSKWYNTLAFSKIEDFSEKTINLWNLLNLWP
jgi:hypothetical protein